ncbi:MAG: hypothetical protein ABW208_15605 [Pyrinomonadaceae bacterium]
MSDRKRPSVRISFKYNKETGEIEDFIIDDSAPTASEEYHDSVARAVSKHLSRGAQIEDAGRPRHSSVTAVDGQTDARAGEEHERQTEEEAS